MVDRRRRLPQILRCPISVPSTGNCIGENRRQAGQDDHDQERERKGRAAWEMRGRVRWAADGVTRIVSLWIYYGVFSVITNG